MYSLVLLVQLLYMSSISAQFDKQCGIIYSSAHAIRDDYDDVEVNCWCSETRKTVEVKEECKT